MNAHLCSGPVEQYSIESPLFLWFLPRRQAKDKLGHNNKMSRKLLSPASFGRTPLIKCSSYFCLMPLGTRQDETTELIQLSQVSSNKND